ncbi:MAG TPA: hypothetical protein DHV14_00330 [Micrococcales bacterium]|uniref:Alpha/beta hydrolase n=1 Tax=Miniimonas arenae TaxID=676201 RepID=A0A5C5BEP4_9MICO|nr:MULTISPECIES: hypothetical protein [Miniimonas]TNU75020.1 hypothetical protein FH969_06240 [Miniimonas arenae]HCX83597.1 hypothetical protein [Micrococcales bacterium]
MASILLVHGRSRPLFGPAQMREQWLVALRSGFEAAGIDAPFADEDVRLPWYGDSLTHLVGGVTRAEAERVSLRGHLHAGEREFVLDVVVQVARAYNFSAAQLAAVAAPDDEGAAPPSWGYVRTVLAAVDRYVPGMTGATVAFVARECYGYLTDTRLRQMIDDGVAGVVRAGEPTVVLAHSLGAVIAYHVLRAHPAGESWRIPLLVTLGAPLAWQAVITALGRLEIRQFPRPVVNWVNARDPQDAVAIGGDLVGSLLPVGAGLPDVLEETGVVNPEDGRHAIEYYLADPLVAAHVARALG